MSAETDSIATKWGSPTATVPVPQERFAQFTGQVPDLLLDFWRVFGFSGFADGLWWICDPVQWQPAVDAWTDGIGADLAMGQDEWIAVSRTAFGHLSLWGKRTGMSLNVIPYLGWIFPADQSDRLDTPQRRDDQIYGHFLAADRDSLDVLGDDDAYLFDRVLPRLGPVGPDTMYGFTPLPSLGGAILPDQVEIFQADVHMQLLAELTPANIMVEEDFR